MPAEFPDAPSGAGRESRIMDGAVPSAATRPPLAVDLDGTLILSDTFHEQLITLFKRSPLAAVSLATTLPRGKAATKRAVAEQVGLDPALLPYNQEFLAFVRAEHEGGRRIGLFTAADQSIADGVARHLGCFDVVRGSDGTTNLSGAAKARAIEQEFGPVFAYAGDSPVDIPIFDKAAATVLVGQKVRTLTATQPGDRVEAKFPVSSPDPETWGRALRVQHWSKNVLVFVAPALAYPNVSISHAILLFTLLGVLASATYLVNDLADLAADRMHPKKSRRPLAAGTLPVRSGVLAACGLLVLSTLASLLLLPIGCTVVLTCYLAITLLYSASLKRLPMIDVTVLAGLFTLRVLAGSMVVTQPLSPWLLTFSMLFFLGLAAIKRYAELHRVVATLGEHGSARGYSRQDIPILLATGVATGLCAIVIFMIYLINEQYPQARYAHPDALWGIMPVLLVWTLRLWHLAVHGRMSEDPVVFALKDRFSLSAGAVMLAVLVVARL